MLKITIDTKENKAVIDITDKINEELEKQKFEEGLAHLFLTHTSAALTTADLDPGTDQDYLEAFENLVPKLEYRHPHDPAHMPDHILSSLIGTSLTIPVEDGKLILGTWQRVVLMEFDGPREREIVINLVQSR